MRKQTCQIASHEPYVPTLYSTRVASSTIDWRYFEEFASLAAMSTCSSLGTGLSWGRNSTHKDTGRRFLMKSLSLSLSLTLVLMEGDTHRCFTSCLV